MALVAKQSAEIGAAMIHLHIRDQYGKHSIDPVIYRRVTKVVRAAVGNNMIIQATSESIGIYAPPQQIAAIRELKPEAVSVALREIVPDASFESDAANFFKPGPNSSSGIRLRFIHDQDCNLSAHYHRALLQYLGTWCRG